MYPIFLAIHNFIRWVVLILGFIAFARALLGWLRNREWTASDRKLGVLFTSAIDLQILIGLILYIFLSPISHDFFRNLIAPLRFSPYDVINQTDFYFGLLHPLLTLLAVMFAHIGSSTSRKATEDLIRHRSAAIWYGLSVLLVVVAIPWSRPLIRGF